MAALVEIGDANYFVLGCVMIVTSVLVFAKLRRRQAKNLPPGPAPWPLIGNLSAVSGPLPHRALHELAVQYGGLMYLRLGSTPCIVVSTAAMALEIFKQHDKNFSSRPQGRILRILNGNYRSVSMAPTGPLWRQLRRICHAELTEKRVAAFEAGRSQELQALLKRIEAAAARACGEQIDLQAQLHSLSSNNMTKMLIDKRYFAEGNDAAEKQREAEQFKNMLGARLQISGVVAIGDFVPCLRFLDDFAGYEEKAEEIQRMTMDTCQKIMNLDGRRAKLAEQGPAGHSSDKKDFVDVLLEMQAEDTTGDFDDEIIALLVQDMLVAGTDTSASTIEWAMAELIRAPAAMERARAELAAVAGPGPVREGDLRRLPYLQAVVQETLRLHPAAPLNLPRESVSACRVAGYDLPARTRLVLNQWAIHRDPRAYDAPDAFRPERFVGAPEGVLRGNESFELVPFGVGRRACPGLFLGNLVVCSVVGNLIHTFDWGLPGGQDPAHLDMSEVLGLTAPRKCPLLVIPKLRSPPSV